MLEWGISTKLINKRGQRTFYSTADYMNKVEHKLALECGLAI
jgi:hypothetical protein